ncbi:MAG TPA: hypothetical protein ENN66_05085 [Proteobacteria bacterium]|nr:hypothetical protein [Pseudomonadota bacterium]
MEFIFPLFSNRKQPSRSSVKNPAGKYFQHSIYIGDPVKIDPGWQLPHPADSDALAVSPGGTQSAKPDKYKVSQFIQEVECLKLFK